MGGLNSRGFAGIKKLKRLPGVTVKTVKTPCQHRGRGSDSSFDSFDGSTP
jgi:hypothetical protein